MTGDSSSLDSLNLASDPANLSFLKGKGWETMQKAVKLSTVDISKYDAIFISGGLVPMADMPENALLKKPSKKLTKEMQL